MATPAACRFLYPFSQPVQPRLTATGWWPVFLATLTAAFAVTPILASPLSATADSLSLKPAFTLATTDVIADTIVDCALTDISPLSLKTESACSGQQSVEENGLLAFSQQPISGFQNTLFTGLESVLLDETVGLWLAVGGGTAAAATLVGGGSSTDDAPVATSDAGSAVGQPPTNNVLLPAHYDTSEYQARADLEVINANEAYANIANLISTNSTAQQGGEGVIIAILDTGVEATHGSLNDNLVSCGSGGTCAAHYGAGDSNGHGTYVAGIAAAEKDDIGMHGVAYNAKILPGCPTLTGGCSTTNPSDGAVMLWAAQQGARVANMSLGPATSDGQRALVASDLAGDTVALQTNAIGPVSSVTTSAYQQAKQALEQGLVVTVAAGNHTHGSTNSVPETGQPSVLAAGPLFYSGTEIAEDLDRQWLAVINVDNNRNLSGSSHACGDAQAFCLAAPGTGIYSTTLGNHQHGSATGTSAATPQVSGAIALVSAAFPSIILPSTDTRAAMCNTSSASYNAQQCHSKAVVNRLLVTATDLGTTGTDAIYGRGLLNLEAATQIIGVPQVMTVAGERHNLADSQLNPSTTMGGQLANALAAIQFIAVDSYDQAGFVYQGVELLGASPSEPAGVDSDRYLQRSLQPERQSVTGPDGQWSFQYTPQRSAALADDPAALAADDAAHYRLQFAVSDHSTLVMATAFDAHEDFGAPHPAIRRLATSNAFNTPYQAFNDQAVGMKYQHTFASGYRLDTGLFTGETANILPGQDSGQQTTSLIVQLSGPLLADATANKLSGNIQLGSLREQHSLLGADGTGVWDLSNGSDTVITGMHLDYRLNSNLHLLFSYFYANTDTAQDSGLLQNTGRLQSNSFSFGLAGHYQDHWHYGLFVSQPLRIQAGSTTLQLPTGYQGYGLAFSDFTIDLEPDGRHLEYEMALRWQPSHTNYLKLNLLRVEDYGHIAGNDDTLLLFSAGVRF